MSRRAAPRWERYGRCSRCFRVYDCRRLGLMSWVGSEMRRPHKGRRQTKGSGK